MEELAVEELAGEELAVEELAVEELARAPAPALLALASASGACLRASVAVRST